MLKLETRWMALAFIFIVAFPLRLWFISGHSVSLEGDELAYDRLAASIMEGKGYVSQPGHPAAGRPPGYPLFLSAIYFFFGRNLLVVL